MRNFVVSLVILLASQSCLSLKNLDKPRWKSFSDAELECVEYLFITEETLQRYQIQGYPDEPSVRKLLNCIKANLNAWDEDHLQIKDYVFKQFFVPNSIDCQYVQHTKECIAQNVTTLAPNDSLSRAYQTFQCYYRNYAAISGEVKWVPFHFSDIVQTLYDCMHIVPHSNQSLLDYCQGRIVTNPDYPRLGYCFFVRSGFYSRMAGIELQKLYVQFGSEGLLKDDTKACVVGAISQYCREPDRFGHIVLDCLIEYLPAGRDIGTAASEALGNPPECGIAPSPPPNTQPCYNGPCP